MISGIQKGSAAKEHFELAHRHEFEEPIETTCRAIGQHAGALERVFRAGWAIHYSEERKVYTFLGNPLGEGQNYHFFVRVDENGKPQRSDPPN